MNAFEWIIILLFMGVLIAMILLPLCMIFEDSETLQAIDEKLAELIRGKEE